MSETMRMVLMAMGVGRILMGLVPMFGAASFALRLGFPAEHDNPTTRLMARLFGVRDIGLGVLIFYAIAHPAMLAFTMLFNACTGFGDLFSIAIPLVRRQGIDRAAMNSAIFSIVDGAGFSIVWLMLR